MFGKLLNRLRGNARKSALERDAELEQMGPEERKFAEESVRDHESEEFVGSELGGIEPERLLGDGRPPRDDVPRD